jgi:hypothetical protein
MAVSAIIGIVPFLYLAHKGWKRLMNHDRRANFPQAK